MPLSHRPGTHVDHARHGGGYQRLAVFGEAGDGGFHLGGELVDAGGFAVKVGGDGLLFDTRRERNSEAAKVVNGKLIDSLGKKCA